LPEVFDALKRRRARRRRLRGGWGRCTHGESIGESPEKCSDPVTIRDGGRGRPASQICRQTLRFPLRRITKRVK
jgi:hypothetical protein